jgi:hypothetical protein
MKWQPIETAPKDGTEILAVRLGGGCDVVEWVDWKPGWWNGDVAHDADFFTHWMPLPEPPRART